MRRQPMSKPATLALALAAAFALAGCGESQDELRDWMRAEQAKVKPSVEPLAAPRPFLPAPYDAAVLADPFSTQKMTGALRREAAPLDAAMQAELTRRREPLEAYPLDAMTMVGSVQRSRALAGLLRVDGLLYQVRPGDHLGPNRGRIVRITETEITLREMVQDAAGDWMPRMTTLQLQEQAK